MLVDDVFIAKIIPDAELNTEEIPPEYSASIAFASPCTGPIRIDGLLDEPDWQTAVAFSGMRWYGDQTRYAPLQTSLRVLYDADNIYFGIEVKEPDCAGIAAGLHAPGMCLGPDKFGADSLEIFLQPPGTGRYYQIVPSLEGYRFDACGQDALWNGTWEAAIRPEQDRWLVEMRIPVADFGAGKVKPGDEWGFNICRNRSRSGIYSTWASVGNYFHNPFAFGKLVMDDFPGWCLKNAEDRVQWNAAIAGNPKHPAYRMRTGSD